MTAQPPKRRIMIASPVYGDPRRQYAAALVDSVVHLITRGYDVNIKWLWGCSDLTYARNDIIDAFLNSHRKTGGPPHDDLVWIDDDIGWKPADLLRLIEADLDVVGAAYRRKQPIDPYKIDSWTFKPKLDPDPTPGPNGEIEVESLGLGFVKMRRKVFEDIIATQPLEKMAKHAMLADEHETGEMYRFCQFTATHGEDYDLFMRVTKAGHKIWIMPDISLVHVGMFEYGGSIAEYADKKFSTVNDEEIRRRFELAQAGKAA